MILENLIAAIVVHESRGGHLVKVVGITEQEAQGTREQQGNDDAQRDDTLEDALETQQLVTAIDIEYHDCQHG